MTAIFATSDEHDTACGRQEQAAHDQAEIAGLDPGHLRPQMGAHAGDLAREQIRVARPSAACAILPSRCAFRCAPAATASPAHLAGVHGICV